MKRIFLLSCIASLAAGCTSNSPTEIVIPFEPGIWSGIFAMRKDFGVHGVYSASGVVTFHVVDSSYWYEANVLSWNPAGGLTFWGSGTKLVDGGVVRVSDHMVWMFDD